jgi:hypothetical protein
MNEVTLKATAVDRAIDNGLQIDVTGSGHAPGTRASTTGCQIGVPIPRHLPTASD